MRSALLTDGRTYPRASYGVFMDAVASSHSKGRTTVDVNITFCRHLLSALRPDLASLGLGIFKDASLCDFSYPRGKSGAKDYHFETRLKRRDYVEGADRHANYFNIYVEADNAYEARYNGWVAYLRHIGVPGYQIPGIDDVDEG